MASAKQCDICGKYYNVYNEVRSATCTNGIMFVNVNSKGEYWAHEIQDCCPECMKSIREHLAVLKKGGPV